MKKFLFALALGALLVLALATTVTADNGPHGGFNGSTDASLKSGWTITDQFFLRPRRSLTVTRSST